jgi:hypothetical protein
MHGLPPMRHRWKVGKGDDAGDRRAEGAEREVRTEGVWQIERRQPKAARLWTALRIPTQAHPRAV